MILGIYTASVYCDHVLRDNGFPAECVRNKSVVVIKSHFSAEYHAHMEWHRPIEKVILLTRKPHDTLRAFYNFKAAGHTGLAQNDQGGKVAVV